MVAVIGPNGSGKSTLFNAITALVETDGGSIRFHGEELVGLPPHEILEKGVARTFQNLRLFINMTVMDNALASQHVRLKTSVWRAILRPPSTRAEEKAAREWAMEVFSIFGNRLVPRVEQMVTGLSYANRRRIRGRPRPRLAPAHPAAG